MNPKRGIDVSHHQGEIDFQKVKAAGIEFVILRAGYGKENPSAQTDRMFRRNYSGAVQAGLPCGAYHYSYAKTPREAEQEADFFLSLVKGCRFEYPVAFDLEDASQKNLGRDTLTAIAAAFCERVERAGYYVCLYTNSDWMKNRLDMKRLNRYDIWLARYAGSPGVESIGMWQYSSTGRVDGISGAVDLDFAYRDYPALMRAKLLNGFSRENATYTVRPGDTMTDIAARCGVTLNALVKANPRVADPNRIFPGDVLAVPR